MKKTIQFASLIGFSLMIFSSCKKENPGINSPVISPQAPLKEIINSNLHWVPRSSLYYFGDSVYFAGLTSHPAPPNPNSADSVSGVYVLNFTNEHYINLQNISIGISACPTCVLNNIFYEIKRDSVVLVYKRPVNFLNSSYPTDIVLLPTIAKVTFR